MSCVVVQHDDAAVVAVVAKRISPECFVVAHAPSSQVRWRLARNVRVVF